MFLQGCSLGTDCDCGPSGLELNIERPATQLQLTGACSDATVRCSGGESAGADKVCGTGGYHRIDPKREGICEILVDFEDGSTFQTEVDFFFNYSGCCSGSTHGQQVVTAE